MVTAKKTYDHKLNVLPSVVIPDDHYFIKQPDGSVNHYIGDNSGMPRLVGGVGGSTGSDTYTGIAGQNLGGGKLVYLQGGKFYLFDANNVGLADLAFGITKTAATINNPVDVQISGIYNEAGLGLTPDAEYYASITGLLTTTPINTVITSIGIALTADKIKIEIQPSIITV